MEKLKQMIMIKTKILIKVIIKESFRKKEELLFRKP